MNTVTESRTVPAPPSAVRSVISDHGSFMRAAGFDSVDVEDGTIRVANRVGIAEIELELAVVDDPDAAFAYEQREGIFEEMRTTFVVSESAAGTEVTATTEFALDVAVVGELLDATVIERQRRKELTAQLDHLEAVATS